MVHDFGNDALQPVVVPPYPGLHSVQIIVIRIPDLAEVRTLLVALAEQEKTAVQQRLSAEHPQRPRLAVIVQVARVGDRPGGQPTAKTSQVVSARNEDPAYVAASESEIRKDVVVQPVQLPVAFLP